MIAIVQTYPEQEEYYTALGSGYAYLPERLDMLDTVDTDGQPITLTISRVSHDLYHQYIAYGVTADAQLYMFTGMDPTAHWVAASLLTIDDVSVLPLAARLAYYERQRQA